MPTRTEEMASKAMGAMKDVKAAIKGFHGVFKKLAEEHGEVTALLLRVKSSSDTEVRRDLFPKIRAELLGHEKGELRNVYPLFAQNAELAPIAKAHDQEAGELERAIGELYAMPYTSDEWGSKFNELVDLVSHHVDEEEGEYFPKAERILGEHTAEEMRTRYEQTKSEVTQQAMQEKM